MESEAKVDVVEQLEGKAKKIQTEYAIAPDGTILKAKDLRENPESPEKQLS